MSARMPDRSQAPRVRTLTVVGGGLIGLFTALYAAQSGFEVQVLERKTVGSGAARGNAGEICPALSKPLGQPGMVKYAAVDSFARDAALHVRFPPSVSLMKWVWEFSKNCTSDAFMRNWEALAPFSQRSLELYRDLPEMGVLTPISRNGNLRLYTSRETAERDFTSAQAVRRLGQSAPERMMTGDELRELEPLVSDQVVAGHHWPDQWFVDPDELVDDIVNNLLERGVTIHEYTEVTSVNPSPQSVRCDAEGRSFTSDAVVIASGAWVPSLLEPLGVRAPVQAGKGYSFSLSPTHMPAHVINMPESNAVATPMGDRLRIAGVMEFEPSWNRINPRRVERIVNAATPYLRDLDWSARTDEWVGPRPMTPDGLPLIGPVRGSERVIVAAGHNMMGLTQGPVTADLVVHMLQGTTPAWSAAFDANRFSRRQ